MTSKSFLACTLVQVLALLTCTHAITNFAGYSSCQNVCACSEGSDGRIFVKCSLAERNKTIDALHLPEDVYNLDLSKSGLTNVPTQFLRNFTSLVKLNFDLNAIVNLTAFSFEGLTSLQSLSIQHNGLYRLHNNSLSGLDNLKTLNLGMNNLHIWEGEDLSHDIPNLESIEITNAIFWVPDVKLLKLRMLREMIGVTWCKWCKNCTVVNPSRIFNDTARKRTAEKCVERFNELKFLEIGKPEPTRFFRHGYLPECMCVKKSECEFRQLVMPYFKKRTTLPQKLFYLEYVISPLTILFNLVVIVAVLTSAVLRCIPSFVLIANMAIIDCVVGIYAISVANVNIKEINNILEELMWTGRDLRPSTGPIFIAGQLISVSIGALLTLERYLAVVYCMKTEVRMTFKSTVISVACAWGAAITFAILPIFNVGGMRYNIKRACAPLSYDVEYEDKSSTILLTFLAIIVVFYFVNIPLYYKIFHFVKKSSNQVGVKREISLARKIALLVLTNFIFFAIPIILILIVSIFAEFDDNPFDFGGDAFESTVFKITVGQWLPVTCLNINALLDPFLYAFRHTLFKRHVARTVYKCTGRVLPVDDSVLANSIATKAAKTEKHSKEKSTTDKC